MAVFLLFTGLFLWIFPGAWNVMDSGMASMSSFFALAPWILMFMVPAVTMRSFSEEQRQGTLELLLTRPLSDGQVVLAKFLGTWAVSVVALLPTLSYVAACSGSRRGTLTSAPCGAVTWGWWCFQGR